MTPTEVSSMLGRYRLPVGGETDLQAEIEKILTDNDVAFEREVVLAPGDRIDFVVEGIGVEIKVKGSKRRILRQCERYCRFEIDGLVLVTAVATGFPATIEGKPVVVHSLGRSWL